MRYFLLFNTRPFSVSSYVPRLILIINYSSTLAPHTIITQPTSSTSVTPYFCYFVFLLVYLFYFFASCIVNGHVLSPMVGNIQIYNQHQTSNNGEQKSIVVSSVGFKSPQFGAEIRLKAPVIW